MKRRLMYWVSIITGRNEDCMWFHHNSHIGKSGEWLPFEAEQEYKYRGSSTTLFKMTDVWKMMKRYPDSIFRITKVKISKRGRSIPRESFHTINSMEKLLSWWDNERGCLKPIEECL